MISFGACGGCGRVRYYFARLSVAARRLLTCLPLWLFASRMLSWARRSTQTFENDRSWRHRSFVTHGCFFDTDVRKRPFLATQIFFIYGRLSTLVCENGRSWRHRSAVIHGRLSTLMCENGRSWRHRSGNVIAVHSTLRVENGRSWRHRSIVRSRRPFPDCF